MRGGHSAADERVIAGPEHRAGVMPGRLLIETRGDVTVFFPDGVDDADVPAPAVAPARAAAAGRRWLGRYQLVLVVVDFCAALAAAGAGVLVRHDDTGWKTTLTAAVLLPFAWVLIASCNHAYERRLVGVGQAEFQLIFRAFMLLAALITFTAFAVNARMSEPLRGFVLVALPTALTLDLAGRYAARKVLHRMRARGYGTHAVLAVGDLAAVVEFAQIVTRDHHAGMRVVGACLTGELSPYAGATLDSVGVPLLGGVDTVVESCTAVGAGTVAVVSSSHVGTERLRWITWQLEGADVDLVVSPGIAEVAGRRLHIQPVAGLPLLHVEQPDFRGFRRLLKNTFDRGVAALTLLGCVPLFIAVWCAIRLTSKGPCLYRQTRIGRDGESFVMFKFRSMYLGADARLGELRQHNVHGATGPLFKIHDDPRVTPVGRFLRRYSIDELPQLVNVLSGRMSLVGPRPPLPSEVEQYRDDARRRLLVKPGLTGLWQISGRSDLSWDESVQLDLRYVENWSPALDLMILWKTVFAVARGSGAY